MITFTGKVDSYVFEPAFLMFMLIDVWRMAAILNRTINPYITFLFTWLCTLSVIQASLAAVSCTFFVVRKPPSHSNTSIICMKFSMAFRWEWPARQYWILWKPKRVLISMSGINICHKLKTCIHLLVLANQYNKDL